MELTGAPLICVGKYPVLYPGMAFLVCLNRNSQDYGIILMEKPVSFIHRGNPAHPTNPGTNEKYAALLLRRKNTVIVQPKDAETS